MQRCGYIEMEHYKRPGCKYNRMKTSRKQEIKFPSANTFKFSGHNTRGKKKKKKKSFSYFDQNRQADHFTICLERIKQLTDNNYSDRFKTRQFNGNYQESVFENKNSRGPRHVFGSIIAVNIFTNVHTYILTIYIKTYFHGL